MHKYGVGFITCDREDFLHQSIKSFEDDIVESSGGFTGYHTIIVNDGASLKNPPVGYNLIENKKNLGVGKSKNIAIKALLDWGCDYIFLIEDDIIKREGCDVNVFEEYIKYIEATGVQHFMFGYHGPANKGNVSKGAPLPRSVIDYGDDIKILLNLHCVGAFCVYTRKSLEEVGLIDEGYTNAFEHVDHSYMIAKAGMIPGYWWWPDIEDSFNLLDEIQCSEHSSSIRPRADWKENIYKAAEHFYKKHGYRPAWDNHVPDQSESQIAENLKDIYKKYRVESQE
jgi:hypothetical protein